MSTALNTPWYSIDHLQVGRRFFMKHDQEAHDKALAIILSPEQMEKIEGLP